MSLARDATHSPEAGAPETQCLLCGERIRDQREAEKVGARLSEADFFPPADSLVPATLIEMQRQSVTLAPPVATARVSRAHRAAEMAFFFTAGVFATSVVFTSVPNAKSGPSAAAFLQPAEAPPERTATTFVTPPAHESLEEAGSVSPAPTPPTTEPAHGEVRQASVATFAPNTKTDGKKTDGKKSGGKSPLDAEQPRAPQPVTEAVPVVRPNDNKEPESLVTAPKPTYAEQLTASEMSGVIAKHQSLVKRRCWQPALESQAGSVNARVQATIEIDANGQVQSVRASGAESDFPGLSSCIASSISAWKFPTSGGTTRVSVPFLFAGQ